MTNSTAVVARKKVIVKNIRQCTTCAMTPDVVDDVQAGGQKIACPLELAKEGVTQGDGDFCPEWTLNPSVSFMDSDPLDETVEPKTDDELNYGTTTETPEQILPYVFVDNRLVRTTQDSAGALHTSVLLASKYNMLVELADMGTAKVKADLDDQFRQAVNAVQNSIEANDGTSFADFSSLLNLVLSLGVTLPEEEVANGGQTDGDVVEDDSTPVNPVFTKTTVADERKNGASQPVDEIPDDDEEDEEEFEELDELDDDEEEYEDDDFEDDEEDEQWDDDEEEDDEE